MIVKKREKNYSEFYEKWQGRVRGMVRMFGFWGQDLEDQVQQIFTEFVGGDYLSIYDSRRSKQSTFLWNFVKGRCLREITKRSRERAHVPLGIGDRKGELNLSYYAPSENGNDPLKVLMMKERRELVSKRLCNLLGMLREEGGKGVCGLRATVLEMLVQGWNRREIASRLGYSQSSVSLAVKSIRQEGKAKELHQALIA